VPTQGTEVSRGGDSGSWWLEDETNQAVALHFAGYDYPVETALAIAMPPVLAVLNVEIPS
jgi:endonuclease G